MKCKDLRRRMNAEQSPPSRGAWIEMSLSPYLAAALPSPPSRGAWIEIEPLEVA